MKQGSSHIIRVLLASFLVLMSVVITSAQTSIAITECDTFTFTVDSRDYIHETRFVWGIYNASDSPVDVLDANSTLDPALYFVDGMYASGVGKAVKVSKLPVGSYYVRIHVWDEEDCTDNVEMYVMEVVESTLEMELTADSVCIGEPTNVYIRFTGSGPYEVQYTIGDQVTPSVVNVIGGIKDPELIIPVLQPLPVGETTFWIIQIDDSCKAFEFTKENRPRTGIVIYPKPAKSKIYVKE